MVFKNDNNIFQLAKQTTNQPEKANAPNDHTATPQVLGGRGVTQTGMGRVVEVFSRMYKIPAVTGTKDGSSVLVKRQNVQ